MKEVYLLIGGNIGDRFFFLGEAQRLISQQCGQVTSSSAVYETAAWGKEDQPAFLNQVLVIQTALGPVELMAAILVIEQQMGRLRRERNGERNIDIDILYYENEVLELPELTIPHPRIYMRKFALIPLLELNATKIDPVHNKTIQALLEACPDSLEVRQFSK
ncbi:MAG: 2-amino-4-hydroxy-6-hydroxymethyldihydropteridine diphosphokinase [Chitinophagaceae bacterium]|nr:2-amino-4-hydroxy-6-hydroxymethyldihydropteridine diphosphokinase [Chitinophagaceae bacterium]